MKTKFLRKTALVLSVASVALLFGACGGKSNTPDGEVTLNWYYRGNGTQTDTGIVQDRVNELLKDYTGLENLKVSFHCEIPSDYQKTINLALASGSQIDILNTTNLNYSEIIEDGVIVPIDEYVEKTDELKDIIPDWLWSLAKKDGEIYMVPNYQRCSNLNYIITPVRYTEKYSGFDKLRKSVDTMNVDLENLASTMEEYLAAVRSAEGDNKYLPAFTNVAALTKYCDVLFDKFVVFNGDNKVSYLPLTDEWKKMYEISADWFQKGYTPSDILTADASDKYASSNMLNPGAMILTTNNQIGSEDVVSAAYTKMLGFDVKALPMLGKYYVAKDWGAGGHAVTSMCKYPELAVKFLETLHTEKGKEIYNTVVYGIEGKHYDKVDENTIHTKEYDTTQGGVSSSYAAMKWNMGNAFNAYLNQGCVEGENEMSLEINESDEKIVSSLAGFYPNKSKIDSQLTQCASVTEEYSKTLASGAMGADWEKYYNEYKNKMELAGMNEIINELQKQLDDFLKSKKR